MEKKLPKRLVYSIILKALTADVEKWITREEVEQKAAEDLKVFESNPTQYTAGQFASCSSELANKANKVTHELFPEYL